MTVAKPNRRRGYTLGELLISLSITAGLMAAMAGAFSAAGSAVEMNDRYFRAVQQSRTALDLVMTEVRRCQAITAASATSITITPASTDFSGHSITITYNNSSAGSNPSTITLLDNSTSNTMVIASNVTSAAFTSTTGQNMQGQTKTVAVTLAMTVQMGENQITLSDSAAPRVSLVSLYQ